MAAVISYFGLHHLGIDGVADAVRELYRLLVPGGQLVLATWEGNGAIDYGEASDLVATKHVRNDLLGVLDGVGFEVTRSNVEFVDELQMNAMYIEAART